MSRTKLPTAVPLPEVVRHTDDIIFGALDLPVGFDQDRLLINLRAINRFRHAAGLNVISVVAQGGETDSADPNITSVDEGGAVTIGLAKKRVKRPLAHGSLQFVDENDPMFSRPTATVQIDNAELETRIEEKPQYKKGVFDATARAKFLNQAIKRGLTEVNFDTSFNLTRMYGSAGALIGASAFFELTGDLSSTAGAGLIANGIFATMYAKKNGDDLSESIKIFREHRHSLFYGLTPDRYLAAQGLLIPRKLVKARA